MLPEMFWRAKDCACKPATEVLRASKIPIASSPNSIRTARRSESHGRNRRRASQALCQNRKHFHFIRLHKKPRSEDRGTIAGRATIAGRQIQQSGRRCRSRTEDQRKAVNAVAQAGRLRPVVEDVTEMAAATAAVNFGAQHSEGAVFGLADGVFERLVKTRPAGAAFEFRLRGEQRQVAAGAGEDALAMLLEQRARTRTLGAVLTQDLILLRRQLRAPFGIGLFNLEFLAGVCRRSPQPAERSKAKKTGDRREQNTAVDHDGLRATRKWWSAFKYAARRPKLHRSGGIFLTLLRVSCPGCSAAPSLAFAPPRRQWPARRGAGWPRSGLAVCLRQTRLANTLLRPRSFAVTGQRAGSGGTSSIPHPDEIAGDPAGCAAGPDQFERRKQPPAFVAPQNAAGDQLPRHRRRVQALTAEAACYPQSPTQLADLRHAVHGVSGGAAPYLGNLRPSELGKNLVYPARDGGRETFRPCGPGGFRASPHQAVAIHDPEMIDAVGIGHRSLECYCLCEALAERRGHGRIAPDRQQRFRQSP